MNFFRRVCVYRALKRLAEAKTAQEFPSGRRFHFLSRRSGGEAWRQSAHAVTLYLTPTQASNLLDLMAACEEEMKTDQSLAASWVGEVALMLKQAGLAPSPIAAKLIGTPRPD